MAAAAPERVRGSSVRRPPFDGAAIAWTLLPAPILGAAATAVLSYHYEHTLAVIAYVAMWEIGNAWSSMPD